MTTETSIRTARRWLYDQLVEAFATDPLVSVRFGEAGVATDLVAVAGFGRHGQEWGALGNRRVDERYTIDVYIRVRRGGETTDEVDDRCMALLDVVYDVVVEDPRFGGSLTSGYATPMDYTSNGAEETKGGSQMEMVFTIGLTHKRRRPAT